eukprot:Sspe_Gene.42173::Locus_20465_Transcript_1_1_Confidence_1.000_Length_1494::g.42173::m.42173
MAQAVRLGRRRPDSSTCSLAIKSFIPWFSSSSLSIISRRLSTSSFRPSTDATPAWNCCSPITDWRRSTSSSSGAVLVLAVFKSFLNVSIARRCTPKIAVIAAISRCTWSAALLISPVRSRKCRSPSPPSFWTCWLILSTSRRSFTRSMVFSAPPRQVSRKAARRAVKRVAAGSVVGVGEMGERAFPSECSSSSRSSLGTDMRYGRSGVGSSPGSSPPPWCSSPSSSSTVPRGGFASGSLVCAASATCPTSSSNRSSPAPTARSSSRMTCPSARRCAFKRTISVAADSASLLKRCRAWRSCSVTCPSAMKRSCDALYNVKHVRISSSWCSFPSASTIRASASCSLTLAWCTASSVSMALLAASASASARRVRREAISR